MTVLSERVTSRGSFAVVEMRFLQIERRGGMRIRRGCRKAPVLLGDQTSVESGAPKVVTGRRRDGSGSALRTAAERTTEITRRWDKGQGSTTKPLDPTAKGGSNTTGYSSHA